MKRFIYLILMFLWVTPCRAQLKEYAHLYDIDLKEDIPLVWRIKKEYQKETSLYDWKYDFSWRIPSVFNYEFKQDIRNFGAFEKRLANPTEDGILAELKRMPKAYYPYVGPVLHTIKGLSGKVLDLPGIKETKNKFPEKIASRFQNIPNIESVSPDLYIFLSPQFWGEDLASLEFPQIADEKPQKTPKIHINPEYIRKIKEKVRMSDYGGGKSPDTPLGIRHFTADKDTPLSAADVKAFINTLDGIKKFSLSGSNGLRLLMIEPIITYWDTKNGVNENVAFLRNVVNPCQSLVRKVKWAGLREKFQEAIGVEGFGLDDWAYTCDKTIKAYRVNTLPMTHMTIIKLLRKGYYYRILDDMPGYSDEERKTFRYFLEASVHLYDTTETNLEAMRADKINIRNKVVKTHFENMGIPIILP